MIVNSVGSFGDQKKVYDISREEYTLSLMEGIPGTAVAESLIIVSLLNANIPGMLARIEVIILQKSLGSKLGLK